MTKYTISWFSCLKLFPGFSTLAKEVETTMMQVWCWIKKSNWITLKNVIEQFQYKGYVAGCWFLALTLNESYQHLAYRIWYCNNSHMYFEHTLTFDPTYKNPNILLKKCSYCELLESVKRKCRITALVIQVNLTDFLAMFSAQCTRQPKSKLKHQILCSLHSLPR